MRRGIAPVLLVVGLLAGAACGRRGEQPAPKATPARSEATPVPSVKYHQGRGRVVDIDAKGRYIVIQHQEIKNFMDAMTMPFHPEPPALAKTVQVGDQVEFTLKETPDGVVLTEIRKLPTP